MESKVKRPAFHIAWGQKSIVSLRKKTIHTLMLIWSQERVIHLIWSSQIYWPSQTMRCSFFLYAAPSSSVAFFALWQRNSQKSGKHAWAPPKETCKYPKPKHEFLQYREDNLRRDLMRCWQIFLRWVLPTSGNAVSRHYRIIDLFNLKCQKGEFWRATKFIT